MMGVSQPVGHRIHPTAIIDEREGAVEIHETATVGANCVLVGPVQIGDYVRLFPGVVIGCEGESVTTASDFGSPIVVESGSTLREHVVVQRALHRETQTRIGAGCFIMRGSHIAHDCIVESGVIMAQCVILGGHSRVMTRANMGIGSMTHQFSVVGSLAMVGMGAVVIRDVAPGAKVVGNPARVIGRNSVGIERAGVDAAWMDRECDRWGSMATRRAKR